jgi:DNA-binding CsgD family transcriptional regulator
VAIGERVYETRKFPVSLGDNKKGIGGFVRDVTERKRTEGELKAKSLNLEEVNAALRVLLKQREQDKNELEEKILYNVKKLVLPYIERLKERRIDEEQRTYLNILETNLNNIVSPFIKKMSHIYSHFTPTEISVANFIKDGKTIKEIARIFGVSENAVNRHRQNIRNKLSLKKQKINLKTFLMSLN